MVKVRSVLTALALVAWATVATAQPFMTQSLTSTTCPGSGCLVVQVDGQGSVGIQILGTFVGTLQFQQSIDPADASYVTLSMVPNGGGAAVTSATAPGFWTAPIAGARYVRVKMSAYTSGTASVGTVNTVAKVLGSTTVLSTGLFADGSAGAPSLAFASQPGLGVYRSAANEIGFTSDGFGGQTARLNNNNFFLSAGGSFITGASAISTNSWSMGSGDTTLVRDAANTLAQRNTTNAQTFRVYNTFTDASNYERGTFGYSGNKLTIGAERAGTGANRDILFEVNSTGVWQISGVSNAGSLLGLTATGGLGYGTGAGGAVTQITSRATGVTLNTVTGDITLFSAAGSATAASFTVTNSAVAATDNIVVNQKSGTNLYNTIVTSVGAGSFVITFYTTGGTAVDAPVFHFSIVKGANS